MPEVLQEETKAEGEEAEVQEEIIGTGITHLRNRKTIPCQQHQLNRP
jgi:hypothetical protein